MNRLFRVSRVSFVAFALVVGCEDDNPKGWLVDRTRILGARFEATAEPSRASIAPGEAMRVTWLVGAPNGTGQLGWAYAVCPPVVGNLPEPHCQVPPLVSGVGESDGDLVTMELDAPPPEAVVDLEELQVLVAFCEGSPATLDASKFEATCADGAKSWLAAASVRLAAAGPNANPEIGDDAVLFDGAPMAPATARPGTPCVTESSSQIVAAGTKHTVAYRFRGDEREALPNGAENVLASHVVTTGELKRQYSMLEPQEAVPKDVSVEWTAPGRVAEGGRLAEFYFVLRDGRGGAAFARRTVCVRP